MTDPTHTYQVHLTEQEARTLARLACRYETADILYCHMNLCDDMEPDAYGPCSHGPAVISLPEYAAWDYRDALADENGNPNQLVPACVGGSLAEKLLTLYVEIV
jgi:hypothetical protein